MSARRSATDAHELPGLGYPKVGLPKDFGSGSAPEVKPPAHRHVRMLPLRGLSRDRWRRLRAAPAR
jgi:hypothetical protein